MRLRPARCTDHAADRPSPTWRSLGTYRHCPPWLRTAPRACAPWPAQQQGEWSERVASVYSRNLTRSALSPRRGADSIPQDATGRHGAHPGRVMNPHGKPGQSASTESTPLFRGITLSLSLPSAPGGNPPPGHRCHVKESPLLSTLHLADILIMDNTGAMK